jgi:hypothetical protein
MQLKEKRFIINPPEGTLWIGYQKKKQIKTAFTYTAKKKMFI